MGKTEKEPKRKYGERGISLYPLKPEEALAAFMKVNPKKVRVKERKIKQRESEGKSQ